MGAFNQAEVIFEAVDRACPSRVSF